MIKFWRRRKRDEGYWEQPAEPEDAVMRTWGQGPDAYQPKGPARIYKDEVDPEWRDEWSDDWEDDELPE